ncbi:MAG: copper chaperone [Chloroflexi bacterium]|nr:MAG: copper chaperone [Chloroflexota bacterium]
MTNTVTVELPAMYADHHVVEVRRILLELPGVSDVYASSAFHLVEVSFDPQQITEEEITRSLELSGYLEDLDVPVEKGVASKNGRGEFFRHTAVYDQTRSAVTFGQHVSYLGRPLWNCPGMGVIRKMEE